MSYVGSNGRSKAVKPRSNPSVVAYLRFYNLVSAALWGAILARVVWLNLTVGPDRVSEGVATFLEWTQALAVLEVAHSALGLVRSSPGAVAMQIASRLFNTWGIVRLFPQSAAHWAFSAMVGAWCITELVRYPFYWAQLGAGPPYWLEWMRYSFFFVLYPVGLLTEAFLTYRALPAATLYRPGFSLFMRFVLAVYLPSFYVLYTHMIKLRRKALGKRPSQ